MLCHNDYEVLFTHVTMVNYCGLLLDNDFSLTVFLNIFQEVWVESSFNSNFCLLFSLFTFMFKHIMILTLLCVYILDIFVRIPASFTFQYLCYLNPSPILDGEFSATSSKSTPYIFYSRGICGARSLYLFRGAKLHHKI